MGRLIVVCTVVLLVIVSGVASADDKYEAEERGHALLARFFLDLLKDFVHVIDFHISFFPGADGRMRQWVTVTYSDNSDNGDDKKLCQVIASCFGVAEMGKLQLQEVEARPTKGSFNVRACIVASMGSNPEAERNWRMVITKQADGLTDQQRMAAVKWPSTWTFRVFDPHWRRPSYSGS